MKVEILLETPKDGPDYYFVKIQQHWWTKKLYVAISGDGLTVDKNARGKFSDTEQALSKTIKAIEIHNENAISPRYMIK